MDKMREEFEVWHKAVYSYLPRYDIAHDYYLESECDDRYDVWKASRESLAVELPKRIVDWSTDNWADGYNMCRERSEKAIHAAGIRTK